MPCNNCTEYLLEANALPAAFGKVDKIFTEREAVFGCLYPSIGIKGVRVGVDCRISMHKVRRLTNGGLHSASDTVFSL